MEEKFLEDFHQIDFTICTSFDEVDVLIDNLRGKYQFIRCLNNRWYCLLDKNIEKITHSSLNEDYYYIDSPKIIYIFEFNNYFKVSTKKIDYYKKTFNERELQHRKWDSIHSIAIVENIVYICKINYSNILPETIYTFIKNVIL